MEANSEYRLIDLWMRECVIRKRHTDKTTNREIMLSFHRWCRVYVIGEPTVSANRIGRVLSKAGYRAIRISRGSGVSGTVRGRRLLLRDPWKWKRTEGGVQQ